MNDIGENNCFIVLNITHKKSSAAFLAEYLHCFLLSALAFKLISV